MDGETVRGADGPGEVDSLLHRRPRSVGRHGEDVDAGGDRGQAVPRMKEGRLTRRGDHQTDIADHRDVAMDHSMLAADGSDGDLSQSQRVLGAEAHCPINIVFIEDLRLHPNQRIRVGGHQRWDVIRIDVVGVQVGDQDCVQVGGAVPVVREVARVDQQSPTRDLDQHSGMPQMCQLHDHIMPYSFGVAQEQVARAERHGGGDRTPQSPASAMRFLRRDHSHVLSQMARYGFVSILALVVDVSALIAGVEWFGLPPVLAATMSFGLGIGVNFACTRMWVFAQRRHTRRRVEFGLFVLVGVIGLALNAAIMAGLHEGLGVHYLLSKAGSTAIVFFWNFLARRQFIYTGDH